MRIAVFCGSSPGRNPSYAEAAREVARSLVRERVGLVYGGGKLGLMGILADAVLEEGGEVIGVLPRFLARKEVAHERLTELRIVESLHERKATMAELAGAFLALPGGLGTLEELAEVLSWSQLGLVAKPCGVLVVDGFFERFLAHLDDTVAAGFMRMDHRKLLIADADPARLVRRLTAKR